MKDDWDAYFLLLADTVSTKSKDPSTKCGAVITSPEHTVLSTGYNGFPRGVTEEVTHKMLTRTPTVYEEQRRYYDMDVRKVMVEAIHIPSGARVRIPEFDYAYNKISPYISTAKEPELNDRWERRPEKYWWVEHAERNAIYAAARQGVPLNGCTIHVNQSIVCCDCAKGIIQTGIKTVVTPKGKAWGGHKDSSFPEQAEITKTMFREAGVITREI